MHLLLHAAGLPGCALVHSIHPLRSDPGRPPVGQDHTITMETKLRCDLHHAFIRVPGRGRGIMSAAGGAGDRSDRDEGHRRHPFARFAHGRRSRTAQACSDPDPSSLMISGQVGSLPCVLQSSDPSPPYPSVRPRSLSLQPIRSRAKRGIQRRRRAPSSTGAARREGDGAGKPDPDSGCTRTVRPPTRPPP